MSHSVTLPTRLVIDLIVEVCNGMPFLAPLWSRRPVLCLVTDA